MSALDVTAAVEAGARALWEARPDVADLSTWDELDAVIKHKCREHVEPLVTATLAAVQADVDAAVAKARAEGAREALREVADRLDEPWVLAWDSGVTVDDEPSNPRRAMPRRVRLTTWLRARADGVAR